MKKLRQICILLMLAGLVACDDTATESVTQQEQGVDFEKLQSSDGIEQLESVTASNPDDFDSLSYLADMYFESGQYNEALRANDKAIVIKPDCADCYNHRGLALYYLGDVPSALESIDKAVTLNPGLTEAWLAKGFVLVSEGRYQEAVAPLNKVKELDSTGVLTLQADKYLAEAAGKNLP